MSFNCLFSWQQWRPLQGPVKSINVLGSNDEFSFKVYLYCNHRHVSYIWHLPVRKFLIKHWQLTCDLPSTRRHKRVVIYFSLVTLDRSTVSQSQYIVAHNDQLGNCPSILFIKGYASQMQNCSVGTNTVVVQKGCIQNQVHGTDRKEERIVQLSFSAI